MVAVKRGLVKAAIKPVAGLKRACTYCGLQIPLKRVEAMGLSVQSCVPCQTQIEQGRITIKNRSFFCDRCGIKLADSEVRDVTGTQVPLRCIDCR